MFHQKSLFSFEESEVLRTSGVSGLTCIPDFITPAQEVELTNIIDQQQWLTDLKRRVQHYG